MPFPEPLLNGTTKRPRLTQIVGLLKSINWKLVDAFCISWLIQLSSLFLTVYRLRQPANEMAGLLY